MNERDVHWVRAGLLMAALGATLGPVLDGIHTHTGTTMYPQPWALKMAWWVPLLFAGAGIAAGLGPIQVERTIGARRPRPSGAAVAGSMALFVLAYALSGVVPGGNVVRAVVLATLFVISWALFDRTRLGFALGLLTGAIGCAVEIALTGIDAFRHLQPDLLGIPFWLPWLYATASIGLANLGRRWATPGSDARAS